MPAGVPTSGRAPSMADVAQVAGVSHQTVSRVLADGNSTLRRGRPTTFVIDEAWLRERYETEGMTLRQIAALVGYGKASNFAAAFKKRFGVAPREYRASHSNGRDS